MALVFILDSYETNADTVLKGNSLWERCGSGYYRRDLQPFRESYFQGLHCALHLCLPFVTQI